MKKHQISRFLLLLSDWIAGATAWTVFYMLRKQIEEGSASLQVALEDERYWLAIAVIPLVWLVALALLGSYRSVVFKTFLGTIQEVVFVISIGCVVLLLTALSDDQSALSGDFVKLFSYLTVIHFCVFLLLRIVLLSIIKMLIHSETWQFYSVYIGDDIDRITGELSIKLIRQYSSAQQYLNSQDQDLDYLFLDNTEQINIVLPLLLGQFKGHAINVHEDLLPSIDTDIKGSPKLSSNFVSFYTSPLHAWQASLKRTGDIMASLLSLLLLSPIMLWIVIRVRSSSPGEVIFKQERIGKCANPFTIYKFRSMYTSAEIDGPQLATDDDERSTPFGAWMRRWRLDELPQFINVIKGDMSIVGPRPERKYYTDQLIKKAPNYPLLWRAKPGITSWGQIKYGYASSVSEMLQRFRYDLLYMNHIGPFMDLRIIWYTIIVLLQGKGR